MFTTNLFPLSLFMVSTTKSEISFKNLGEYTTIGSADVRVMLNDENILLKNLFQFT